MPHRLVRRRTSALLAAAGLASSGAVLLGAGPAAATTALVGTFQIQAGSCANGTVSGSYLRMILPTGGPAGPYLSNSDSACRDQSYTLLAPGSDGGLVTGTYQPGPNAITQPTTFYGTGFATSTNAKDPQTGHSVPPPAVAVNGTALSADLRAFSVAWNGQNFNQGAPKPDGSTPGNTRLAAGSYDAATGHYSLQWLSQVVGGSFDKFTGLWHLEGRFVPAAGRANPAPAPAPPSPRPAHAAASTVAAAAGAAGRATTARSGSGGQAAAATAASAGSSGSTAAGAVAPGAATSTGPPTPAGPAATALALAGDHTDRSGLRAPAWLIFLIAVIGIAGVLALQWRTARQGDAQ